MKKLFLTTIMLLVIGLSQVIKAQEVRSSGRVEATYAPMFESIKQKILKASQDINEDPESQALRIINMIDAAQIVFDDLANHVADNPDYTSSQILGRVAKDLNILARTYGDIVSLRGAIEAYRTKKKNEVVGAKAEADAMMRQIEAEIDDFTASIRFKKAEIKNTPASQSIRIQTLNTELRILETELASIQRIKASGLLLVGYIANLQALFKAQDDQLGLLLTVLNGNAKIFKRSADYADIQKSIDGAFSELTTVTDFSGTIDKLVDSWNLLDKLEEAISKISITG